MTKQPGKTCGRSSVLRFCLLASCLAVWFPAATTVAQPGSARPAAVVERALAAVRGADRIPLLVELATLRRDEPNALDPLTREALELLSAHPSPALESEARVLRSYALEGKSDYPAALAEAQRAERLAGGLNRDDLRANAAYQVGRVEWRMANYAVAHQKAEAARALQSPLGNSTVLARTLNLIGAIYQSESALDAALEHYLAALHMGEAIGDERSTSGSGRRRTSSTP
jgi:tetratricopeptide (TPR) repeat protein